MAVRQPTFCRKIECTISARLVHDYGSMQWIRVTRQETASWQASGKQWRAMASNGEQVASDGKVTS